MAWLDAADIKKKFNIASDVSGDAIDAASRAAALYIRERIEPAVYAEAVGAELAEDAETYVRQSKIIEAHSQFTKAFAIENLGVRFTLAGGIEQSQDLSSPATSKTVTNKVLTPDDLRKMTADALARGADFLSAYLIPAEVVAPKRSQSVGIEIGW